MMLVAGTVDSLILPSMASRQYIYPTVGLDSNDDKLASSYSMPLGKGGVALRHTTFERSWVSSSITLISSELCYSEFNHIEV